MKRPGLIAVTALLLALPAAAQRLQGPDKAGRIIPYDVLVSLCRELDGIFPQPPPAETHAVGTLDATSGEFVWGRRVRFARDPKEDLDTWAGFGSLFQQHGVPEQRVRGSSAVALTGRPVAGSQAHRPDGSSRPTIGGLFPGAGAGEPLIGHPTNILEMPFLPVHSGMVELVFRVTNRGRTRWSVSIEGRDPITSTEDSLTVLVPPTVRVPFTIRCGDKSFSEEILLDRPPQLGYFILEAMPVTIVYEPPGSSSSQTYSTIRQVGTELRTFTAQETTTTQEIKTPFSRVGDMIDMIKDLGNLVSKVAPEYGGPIKTAGNILAAAWGSSRTQETIEHTVTGENALSFTQTNAEAIHTTAHLGPGRGDVIHYLIKPVFAWLVAQDPLEDEIYLTVALLGYKAIGAQSAEDLRLGTLPEPSQAARLQLLEEDPMTPESRMSRRFPTLRGSSLDPGANPAPRRFVPADPPEYQIAGGELSYSFKHSLSTSASTSQTTRKSRATKEVGGFLSYIAENVPHDGESCITTVQGSSSKARETNTVAVDVVFGAAVGEGLVVKAFYDQTYGTFAFLDVPYGDALVTGNVTDSANRPLAGEEVRLIAGERIIATKTDSRGNYAFRPSGLAPGTYRIRAGESERTFALPKTLKASLNLTVRGRKAALGGKPTKSR